MTLTDRFNPENWTADYWNNYCAFACELASLLFPEPDTIRSKMLFTIEDGLPIIYVNGDEKLIKEMKEDFRLPAEVQLYHNATCLWLHSIKTLLIIKHDDEELEELETELHCNMRIMKNAWTINHEGL